MNLTSSIWNNCPWCSCHFGLLLYERLLRVFCINVWCRFLYEYLMRQCVRMFDAAVNRTVDTGINVWCHYLYDYPMRHSYKCLMRRSVQTIDTRINVWCCCLYDYQMRQPVQIFDAAVNTNSWYGCSFQCLMPLSVRIPDATMCTNVRCGGQEEQFIWVFCINVWCRCLYSYLMYKCLMRRSIQTIDTGVLYQCLMPLLIRLPDATLLQMFDATVNTNGWYGYSVSTCDAGISTNIWYDSLHKYLMWRSLWIFVVAVCMNISRRCLYECLMRWCLWIFGFDVCMNINMAVCTNALQASPHGFFMRRSE